MPHIRYEADYLLYLRDSPLVQKPPGLPSLDQWLEQPAEQNGQRRKQQNNRGDEHTTNNDGGNPSRPMFPTRHSQRNNSEDIFLGPPGTKFGSSSRALTRDNHEKGADRYNAATFGDENDRSYGNRNRGPRDQDDERPRNRTNLLGRRNDNRDTDGEGWSTVNRRRSSHNEEGAERWRSGDHDRNRNRRDNENAVEDGPRRNGVGRNKWRDEPSEEDGGRPAWRRGDRNREQDRDRDRDRDRNRDTRGEREWTRGHKLRDTLDEEPEWMNEPVVKPQVKEERTGEDFERWKAEMKAKASGTTEKEDVVPMFAKESKPAEATKPLLNLSGFGTFRAKENAPQDATPLDLKPAPLKGLGGMGKTSKFGAFFQKEETPPPPPPAYEPEPTPKPMPQMQAPPPPQAASPLNGAGSSSKEDAEGFQRILAMLGGGMKLSSPQPQQSAHEGGAGLSALFPTGMPPNDQGRPKSGTSRPDSASLVNELLARHSANRSRGPQAAPAEPEVGSQFFGGPGGDYGRISGGRDENVPNPRAGPLFSPSNGSRQRPETPTDQKRDFLLKLIESNRGAKPPAQSNAEFLKQAQLSAVTAKGPGPQHLPQMHQPDMQQRVTPSAPSAPPGFDAVFGRGVMPDHDMQGMRKNAGPPQGRPNGLPPFFDEGLPHHDPAILGMPGLPRRNTSDQQGGPPRPPVSNMGIPSQNAPSMDHGQFRGMLPQQEPPRGMAPPPGFGGMRPPPGFQPQPPHLQSPPNGMPPHMRGLDPRGPPGPGMYGNMPPPPPQGQGPPHGYFPGPPPPGFPPNDFFMAQQGRGRGGPPFIGLSTEEARIVHEHIEDANQRALLEAARTGVARIKANTVFGIKGTWTRHQFKAHRKRQPKASESSREAGMEEAIAQDATDYDEQWPPLTGSGLRGGCLSLPDPWPESLRFDEDEPTEETEPTRGRARPHPLPSPRPDVDNTRDWNWVNIITITGMIMFCVCYLWYALSHPPSVAFE